MSYEDNLAKLRQWVELLTKWEQSDQPATIKEAAERLWLGKEAIVEGVDEMVYSEEEQRRDRQKVVPARAVYAVLVKLENKVAESVIVDPAKIALRSYFALWDGLLSLARNWREIWKLIKAIYDVRTLLDVATLRVLVSAVDSKKVISSVFTLGKKAEEEMRGRVLFQSSGKRVWRTRVARQ